MNDQPSDYAAFGEALLEELIVQAGLRQAHDGLQNEPMTISLDFTVSTDREQPALLIRRDRIGHPLLELRIDLE